MNIWAVLYLLVQMLGLGIIAAKNGEPTEHNFWATFIAWVVLTLPLLYMAGTFHP